MEAVDRADRAGNNAEAERVLKLALELAPDHPGVLNAAGMRALGRNELGRALPLLQGAAKLDPDDPLLRVNLALAQRKLGNEAAERDALEQALAIDPRYFPALLQKARLLERQGKMSAASYTYNMFLGSLPAGQHPPAVQ